jgi:hypothetical protein
MVFYVGCTVLLPEPVLEVGPHDLSASFGPFEFCAVNLRNGFYHCYI